MPCRMPTGIRTHTSGSLTKAGAIEKLFVRFDMLLADKGYLAMSGQILDASVIPAPRQKLDDGEKQAIKEGKSAAEIWPDNPAKAAQKDVDARWTLKRAKAKPDSDTRKPGPEIAIPVFGYKSHIGIDRRHGLIRTWLVTDAAAHDGARLREGLIDRENTGSEVWADTAYRSRANEAYLTSIGKRSRIHRKKSPGKPMAKNTARANAAKSKVRRVVEHPSSMVRNDDSRCSRSDCGFRVVGTHQTFDDERKLR